MINNTNDPELIELWKDSRRYGGKGCRNAVRNVVDIIAKKFIGKKGVDFKSIVELDQILLKLETELAIQRGKLGAGAGKDECIQVMQRKINLGMNAILSISLAMARMIAHVQGKDLWQLLRA